MVLRHAVVDRHRNVHIAVLHLSAAIVPDDQTRALEISEVAPYGRRTHERLARDIFHCRVTAVTYDGHYLVESFFPSQSALPPLNFSDRRPDAASSVTVLSQHLRHICRMVRREELSAILRPAQDLLLSPGSGADPRMNTLGDDRVVGLFR